jgi:hypothetical protein
VHANGCPQINWNPQYVIIQHKGRAASMHLLQRVPLLWCLCSRVWGGSSRKGGGSSSQAQHWHPNCLAHTQHTFGQTQHTMLSRSHSPVPLVCHLPQRCQPVAAQPPHQAPADPSAHQRQLLLRPAGARTARPSAGYCTTQQQAPVLSPTAHSPATCCQRCSPPL